MLPAVRNVKRSFNAGVKRLVNPHQYPVGLERKLHDLKTELVLKARHIEPLGAVV